MGKTEILIPILLFNLFFILFIVGIILFIKQYKQKRKEHFTLLKNQQEAHAKELLNTQIEIQNHTMQHIGREIHDNIGQKLTLASLYIQQLSFENKTPQIGENIQNVGVIINESLAELRALSKSLTDDTIQELNVNELIARECNKIKDLKKCEVQFETNHSKQTLPYQVKLILLRIVQEFIQNSVKHANCKRIAVTLSIDDNRALLLLQDDGKGFNVDSKFSGIGLSNMKKRTEILGGKLILESGKSVGTTLRITLPIQKQMD